jgi:DNA-binding MarR family transcriptional regulator
MDSIVKKAGVSVIVVIAFLTLALSIGQDAGEAGRFGAVAWAFDPLIVAVSFLLGALISLLLHWGIDIAHFEKILRLLPLKEQKVLEVLSTCKSATLEYLCYASKLPKATVAKILSLLQGKDIIKRIQDGSAILVESRIYLLHQASKAVRGLPGLSERRLLIILATVILFGMSLSVLNSYHISLLQYPLRPTAYMLSVEFILIGAISSLMARRLIADIHFKRAIKVLPEDEQTLLKHIFLIKSITQHDLVQKTGMHKMKVSRILGKFQEKGLVDRISYGYTNLVVSKI